MMELSHRLDRTILIEAPREVVFRYFTDNDRWSAWWGAGSTIEPRPGGRVLIRYPNAVEATGEVIEVTPPHRIVFTYGYVAEELLPHAGGSRVTIRLEPAPRGTRLHLLHEFAEAAIRDHHVQGWRYQLSVFANVVSDDVLRDAPSRVSRWFEAWADTNDTSRRQALAAIASPDIRMHDRFSCVEGIDELTAHIGAAQRFMAGVKMQASGDARQCQGVVLADWVAAGDDGPPRSRGTNVFVFGPDGLIESVTGFWSPPAA
jgi:uncharacterized protein YndB with AHSA1/START domain